MGINLENELVQNKRAELSEWDRFTIKKVEEYNAIDGVEVLNRLGMYSSNKEEAEVIKGKVMNVLDYNPERVFSENDVRRLCTRYGLRCLPAHMFNGEVDADLPRKIVDFEKNYALLDPPNTQRFPIINGVTRRVEAYICAPVSSFKLESRPKDPLFFVRVEYGHAVNFILLHKWGNDISPWRLITNLWRRTFLNMLITFSLLLVGFGCVFSPRYGEEAWFACIIVFVMSLFALLLTETFCISNRCKWDEKFE